VVVGAGPWVGSSPSSSSTSTRRHNSVRARSSRGSALPPQRGEPPRTTALARVRPSSSRGAPPAR
jgi:hypothetical protein